MDSALATLSRTGPLGSDHHDHRIGLLQLVIYMLAEVRAERNILSMSMNTAPVPKWAVMRSSMLRAVQVESLRRYEMMIFVIVSTCSV
jgi:hypothetical protein